MIKRFFVIFDIKLLRTLYTTFVRLLIDFVVPVWSPYLKDDIETLERVQHKVTRIISLLFHSIYGKTFFLLWSKSNTYFTLFKKFNKLCYFIRDKILKILRFYKILKATAKQSCQVLVHLVRDRRFKSLIMKKNQKKIRHKIIHLVVAWCKTCQTPYKEEHFL